MPTCVGVRTFIDMCVFDVDGLNLCWYINFIEKRADDFQEQKALITKFTDERKSKHVFCHSLWKSKKQLRDMLQGRISFQANLMLF